MWPAVSQSTLEARYKRPASRFAVVEDVSMHFLDEGPADGPVVVMSSAQWACFSQWDSWMPALADRYRVIRIDLPGHGLTGEIPSGDYSFEMYERLLLGTLDAIGIDRFALIGTSFSGTIAFRYATKPGHRLTALVLANASGLPRLPGKAPNEPPPQWLNRVLMPHVRTRGFMRWKLGSLILNHALITPALVREFADMNNRRNRLKEAQARAATYKAGDPQSLLAKITVPTLVLGSTGSTYLAASDADRYEAWLTAAPVRKMVYPNVGHLIAFDAGSAAAADVRAFLDERVDRC